MYPLFSKYLVHFSYYFITSQKVENFKRQFEKTQWYSYEMIQDMQWKKLKQMIDLSYINVPFYRNRFDKNNIRPRDISNREDLLKIPVLTKEDIKNNFDALKVPLKDKKVFPRQTSGSSGSPLRIIKDSTSMAVMDAIMHRNYEWFDIKIGEKQARYWGSPLGGKEKIKVRLKDILLNRIRFSPFNISESACADFLVKLHRFNPGFVYGYAQTIFKFSEYILRKGIDLSHLRIKVVIITGEMIFPDQIQTIERAFQCLVSNEYGSTEVGIIAMECPSKGMHLMIENLFIEFIKDGRHAEPGEEGEIIITELYGNLMPLIRYQVGDIGSLDDTSCQCGRGLPLLGRLKGRNDEFIICPDGRQVDPIIFEYILKEIPEKNGKITQFRITQENPSQLDIEVCFRGDKLDILLDAIDKKLKKVVGKRMIIHFNVTDIISAEASGKLRCFISKIKD